MASVVRIRNATNVVIDGSIARVKGVRANYIVNINAGLAYLDPSMRAIAVDDALVDDGPPVTPSAGDADPTLTRTLSLLRVLADDGSIDDAALLAQITRG